MTPQQRLALANPCRFAFETAQHVVLPDGRTMAEASLPQIQKAYQDGKMPPLLGFQS